MAHEHPAVRPVRHTRIDTSLATNVRGIHGYQAYCACGWEGEVWKSWGQAQWEARWHRVNEHALPWEAVPETPSAGATD